MPLRDDAPLGAPCWVDLQTSDPERAKAFYGELLGWEAEDGDPAFGGYLNFRRYDVRVAGCMRSDAQAPVSDVWSVYLRTDDAAKTLETAAAHGGQVIVPAMPVGDMGVMGFLIDASGAAVGVWQPGSHRGTGAIMDAGTASWFELHTRDHAAAVRFYRDVFGWETSVLGDTDEFRYTQMTADGAEWAGIMDASAYLPDVVPPYWAVYFAVDDTDAAVATLTRLGGAVHREPTDSPYGRIAEVADPLGASFRLVGPNVAEPQQG